MKFALWILNKYSQNFFSFYMDCIRWSFCVEYIVCHMLFIILNRKDFEIKTILHRFYLSKVLSYIFIKHFLNPLIIYGEVR